MKKFTSPKQKLGEQGEAIAVRHISSKGFLVLERNYTQKWGEIDIIALKDKKVHFIEVKSVSCDSFNDIDKLARRPEDQMSARKQGRLRRTIQTYMANREGRLWQFDLALVYMDTTRRRARVRMMKDIIL